MYCENTIVLLVDLIFSWIFNLSHLVPLEVAQVVIAVAAAPQDQNHQLSGNVAGHQAARSLRPYQLLVAVNIRESTNHSQGQLVDHRFRCPRVPRNSDTMTQRTLIKTKTITRIKITETEIITEKRIGIIIKTDLWRTETIVKIEGPTLQRKIVTDLGNIAAMAIMKAPSEINWRRTGGNIHAPSFLSSDAVASAVHSNRLWYSSS